MRTVDEIAVLAAEDKPVTGQEAEALIRYVKRTCRGLAVLPADLTRALHTSWNEAEASRNWDQAFVVCVDAEKCSGALGPAVEDNDWEGLWRRTSTAIYAHGDTIGKPCGQDFNDIICAGPFDGKQHEYMCPACGQKGFYGAPRFTVTETVG